MMLTQLQAAQVLTFWIRVLLTATEPKVLINRHVCQQRLFSLLPIYDVLHAP